MPEITGTIQDEAESLYVGSVQFENLDAPCVGGVRITGPHLTEAVTSSLGALPAAFRLAPGRTRLIIQGRKSKPFTVPEGNGSYDLNALMAAAASAVGNRVVLIADTIADLRAFPSSSSNWLAFVESDANGQPGMFWWDSAITADDLDNGVFVADDGDGGWRRKGL